MARKDAFRFFFQLYSMGYALGLVNHITSSRINNAAKIWWSYHQSRRKGKSLMKGLPISMSFEPTTACNLGCTECPSGLRQFTRETGNLSLDFFKDTISQVSQHLVYLTLYFQGEPYINPRFFDIVEEASSRKIFTATSTNGHFLDEERAKRTVESGLGRLIISIDGTSQESYEKYRVNGDLDKVIDGVKRLESFKKKYRRGPYTEVQFIVFKHNEHQMEDMKKLYRELGSDKLSFKTAQLYNYESKTDLLPNNEDYSRYSVDESGIAKIKNKLLNQCWRMWHSCVITWDGLVVPCCFDKDATHQLGDLKENSLEEIWYGEKYQQFRSKLLRSRSEIDICSNCTEGTQVWVS